MDPKYVIFRLEEAGATLMSLPHTGRHGLLSEAITNAQHASFAPLRAKMSVPSAAAITRMDQALGWICLIPPDRYVLRRVVGARALVSPITQRHLYSWRRLGQVLGADHKAVQRWHADGIAIIARAVAAQFEANEKLAA